MSHKNGIIGALLGFALRLVEGDDRNRWGICTFTKREAVVMRWSAFG